MPGSVDLGVLLPHIAGLSEVCVAAMGGSHPLAKRVGAWPAVAAVTGFTVPEAGAVAPSCRLLALRLPDRVRAGRHRRRR